MVGDEMRETYISTVHSESGRHTGVIIISDDAKFIRDSKRLTDAIKSVYGGDEYERPKADGGGARKQ